MTNLEQATWLVKAFKELIHATTLWVRAGEKDAAIELMKQMTARNLLLKSLGLMLADNGKLVEYREPTGLEKRKIYLIQKAAAGDVKSAQELLDLMSKSLFLPES